MILGKEVDGYDSDHGSVFSVYVSEMGTVLDIVVCNAWFEKRDIRLFTYN